MLDFRLIETDSFDRDAFVRALRGAAGCEELFERGERLVPHFEALVEDLFAVLFKLVIHVRPPGTAPASAELSRRILLATMASPGLATLKEETVLDAARAVHGACVLARRALALLKSGELLLEEELLAAHELAREEEQLERDRAAADDLPELPEAVRRTLQEQVERSSMRVAQLTKQLDQALEEMPPRFDGALAEKATKLSEDLSRFDEEVDGFARSVGGNGPRSASERLRLAEKLETSEKLRQLAQLAGAFRAEARAARRSRRERAATEVYRVGRGADVGRILPAELTGLRHPLRRSDFLRRFLEGELAQYDLRGDDRHGRGPMIVCIDGSGSMSGSRELWAKAVALALLDLARRQGRRTKAFVFSGPETNLSAFELTARGLASSRRPVDLDQVVKLAECFPGGGTDFEKPLRAALEAACTSPFKGADVVFITDGEAPISEGFALEFHREKKKRDLELLAVLVDDAGARNKHPGESFVARAARELGKVADRMTTVTELTSKSAKPIFGSL